MTFFKLGKTSHGETFINLDNVAMAVFKSKSTVNIIFNVAAPGGGLIHNEFSGPEVEQLYTLLYQRPSTPDKTN
jgi:hypothetical protein